MSYYRLIFLLLTFMLQGCKSYNKSTSTINSFEQDFAKNQITINNLETISEEQLLQVLQFVEYLRNQLNPMRQGEMTLQLGTNEEPMNNAGYVTLNYNIKNADKFNPIFIHEFAHNYFSTWMKEHNSDYFSFYSKRQEKIFLMHEYDHATVERQEAIIQRNLDITATQSKLDKAMFDITAPYDELFADTVTVILANDPLAISNAMPLDDNRGYKQARRFDQPYQLLSFTNDKYIVFSELRFFLWTKFQNSPEYRNDPAKFLLKLIEIMNEAIKIRIKEETYKIDTNNYRQIIDQFYKLMQK